MLNHLELLRLITLAKSIMVRYL